MPAAVLILQLVALVIRSLADPVNAEPMDKKIFFGLKGEKQ
jgi:hypothetical protein